VQLKLPGVVRCRSVDLAGDLDARIEVEGAVILRSGAVLRGQVKCASLQVEEGAALVADVVAGRRGSLS